MNRQRSVLYAVGLGTKPTSRVSFDQLKNCLSSRNIHMSMLKFLSQLSSYNVS